MNFLTVALERRSLNLRLTIGFWLMLLFTAWAGREVWVSHNGWKDALESVREQNGQVSNVDPALQPSIQQRGDRALAVARQGEVRCAVLLVVSLLVSAAFGVAVSRSVNNPLRNLQDAVERLARGELDHEVPLQDYNTEMGALARALSKLRDEAQQMEAERWLRSNVAGAMTELQPASSLSDLSDRLFSCIAPLLKLGQALFYVVDGDAGRLRPIGGYACGDHSSLGQDLAVGEGLVGQCAVERKPIFVEAPPAGYIHITSALGGSSPRAIVVLPLLRNDLLLGVLELATFEPFGPREQALIDSLLPILAMNVEILQRHALQEAQRIEIERANFLADIALELTDSGYWHVDYSDPEHYYQSERAAALLGEAVKPDGRYHLTEEWFSRLLEADVDAANHTAERYQGAIDGRYDRYDATYAYKRPFDGQIIWVRANGKLVRDPQTNKILYMYGAYQNVTQRKRDEDDLKAAIQAAETASQALSKHSADVRRETLLPAPGASAAK